MKLFRRKTSQSRTNTKRKILLTSALTAVLVFLIMGISTMFGLHTGLTKTGAEAIEDGSKVEQDSELKYFLNVKYDGVDKNGVQSDDTTMSTVLSGQIQVEDKLPAGLIFQSFVETSDGSIGAVSRDGNSTPCAGRVIDDTGSTTGWINNNTEFVYHGLHYHTDTRTVTFQVEKLRAGCQVSVGIVTKTPTLPTGVNRMDFFNTASVLEGTLNNKSNTVHVYIGSDNATMHNVTYRYTTNSDANPIPANAPSVPTQQQYPEGSEVAVEAIPSMNGYDFVGWTPVTSGVNVNQGTFTMPTSDVIFEGYWQKKSKYSVTYQINGTAPEGYLVPKPKSYGAGDQVSLDSLKKGDVINGYRFLGWTNTDLGIDPSVDPDQYPTGFTMPSNNVVLTGQFEEIKYNVSYEFEGAVIPPVTTGLIPATTQHAPGTSVTTATSPITAGTFVNSAGQTVAEPGDDGQAYYKFLGWYKAPTFLMPEEDVVIKGEWMQLSGVFTPEITKEVTNATTHPDGFKKNEKVEFDIKIKNTANYAINTVAVSDEDLQGAKFTRDAAYQASEGYTVRTDTLAEITTIPAGATKTLKAEFTVVDDAPDMLTNKVKILGALAENNHFLDCSAEGACEDTADFLIQKGTFTPEITKTVDGATSGYKIGDTVKFTVTVTNPEEFNLTNVQVVDRLTGAKFTAGSGYTVDASDATKATISALSAGESITLNAEYTISQNTTTTYTNTVQITGGTAENRYTLDCSAEGACTDDTTFTTEHATFTPTITKTIPNEKTAGYKKGETVNFVVAVTNTANFAIKNVKVEERLNGAKFVAGSGYTLSNSDKTATITTIAAGATVNVNAQYTVTDDSQDSFTNVVEITDAQSDNGYDLDCPSTGCKADEEFKITGDFAPEISKAVVGATSGYKIGDTVNFTVTVTNPESFDLKNVIIEEQLAGAEFIYGSSDNYDRIDATTAKIQTLAAGTHVVLNAKYIVTTNIATTYENVTEIIDVEPAREGWTLEDGDYTAKAFFSTAKGEFTPTISKSIPGEKTKGYKKGETVNFQIKVKNEENFDLKNVTIEEQLAGAKFVTGTSYDIVDDTHARIAIFAAGTEITLNAQYTVTDDSQPTITNNVRITSASSDNGYELNCQGACTAEEEFNITGDFTIEITKSIPNEKSAYKKGETVNFEIKVKNLADFKIRNVVVEERLSGAKFVTGSGYTVNTDTKATVTEINAGATATLNAQYTVVDDLPDSYTNVVEVTDAVGENDWELDKTKTYRAEEEFLIEKGTFTPEISKAVNGSTSGYKIGDTVNFTVTVTNPESYKLTDVKVNEQLTGAKFVAGSGYTVDGDTQVTIAEIPANGNVAVNAQYVVSTNTANTYTNKVKIISASAENRYTLDCADACEAEVNFETKKGTFTPEITKTIPNEKTEGYKRGEKVSFEVKVTNPTSSTLRNVVVNENLAGVKFVSGSGYALSNNNQTATITSISAGATITLGAEYTVSENAQTTLKNVVTLTSASSDNGYELQCPTTGCQAEKTFDITRPDFAPEIKKTVKDAKEHYKKGDKVTFEVSVKNTADFAIKDVVVVEQLTGTNFIAGEGYEVDAEDATKATIAEISAGATVVLTSEYEVTEDATLTIENIAQLVSATGENGEKLKDGDYTAKVKFNTVKEPAPIVPSNPDPTPPASPFTGDNILSIAVIAFSALALTSSLLILSVRKRA